MPPPTVADIREIVLQVIHDKQPKQPIDAYLQQTSVLNEVQSRLRAYHNPDLELAILTIWHDLFRTGYLAWGYNLANPNPPFFNITDRGRQALERLSRDPGNPAGYLKHMSSLGKLNPVANSYLVEGLECFVAGLYKAAAVMLGVAAESLVLELRDSSLAKLGSLEQSAQKDLCDWKLKSVTKALYNFLKSKSSKMPIRLGEEFESYWGALVQQIRTTRNEAGHPSSRARNARWSSCLFHAFP